MSRKDLDDVLIKEGFFPQNTLRAIKSLARRHLVALSEGSSRKESVVRLPREARVLSDDEIAELLNASPDKWVVNGYPAHYETTYLRASFD